MPDQKSLRDRVAAAIREVLYDSSWDVAAEKMLARTDFAVVERDRVLTPEDERVLEALKADMEAERSAYAPAHSFPDTWKKVLAAISANPRLTPPAPKLPVWTMNGAFGAYSIRRDGEHVTTLVQHINSAEALAMMTALADARDGAGKWRKA